MFRISKHIKMPPIDKTRYDIHSSAVPETLASTQAAIVNLKARSEELNKSFVDLELLKEFGANAWLRHAEFCEAMDMARRVERLAAVEAQITEINICRKKEQESVRDEIERLEEKWWKMVRKNNEIETACKVLEIKIEDKRANNSFCDFIHFFFS